MFNPKLIEYINSEFENKSFISNSFQDTFSFAKSFACKYLTGGEIIFFHSPLGGGKTSFIKGLASGLGITKSVNSPTFNILKIYKNPNKNKLDLYHFDCYRLENIKEDNGLDIQDLIDDNAVYCFEWPEYLYSDINLFNEIIHVDIKILDDESREIKLSYEKRS